MLNFQGNTLPFEGAAVWASPYLQGGGGPGAPELETSVFSIDGFHMASQKRIIKPVSLAFCCVLSCLGKSIKNLVDTAYVSIILNGFFKKMYFAQNLVCKWLCLQKFNLIIRKIELIWVNG